MLTAKEACQAKIKLTPFAKIFYVEWVLEPDSYRYNMLSADQVLHGPLDLPRLRSALIRYVEEHVLLNSHIQVIDDEPCWIKNSTVTELEYFNMPIGDHELLELVQRPFNVNLGPMYRFILVKLAENVHRFLVVFHHLVMDGISLNRGIIDAISNYYNQPTYRAEHSLNDQINLLDNLHSKLTNELKANQEAYQHFWRQQLSDLEVVNFSFLQAPTFNSSQESTKNQNPIAEIRFDFNSEVFNKLKHVCKKFKLIPFIYSQCIYAILLHKYSNQRHFAVGYTLAVREGADFIYGGQINVNLVPYHFEPESSPLKILESVCAFFFTSLKGQIRYAYTPIYDIFQTADNNKKLLQVMFGQAPFRDESFHFTEIEKAESLQTLCVDTVTRDIPIFDQEMSNDKLNFRFKFHRESINQTLLHTFLEGYKKLFVEILDDLYSGANQKLIADYLTATPQQYQEIIYDLNKDRDFGLYTKAVHQLFEDQSKTNPNKVAIVYENTEISYGELNCKANQLAHYINSNCPIRPDDLVVLYLDKNVDMLIAILAVLKCGAAYVPIDPDCPVERARYILEDIGSPVAIINKKYESKLFTAMTVIKVDEPEFIVTLNNQRKANLNIPVSAENLIYAIYTSGTTGNPKGVLQQHGSITALFHSTEKLFDFNENDIWLFFHSYVFDVSVWELWGALIYGGRLVIPNAEQTKDFKELAQLCSRTEVTVINQTPSAFYKFSDIVLSSKLELNTLRYVIFAGEKLNFLALSSWCSSQFKGKPKLINMFGITEVAVLSTYAEIHPEQLGNHSNIGKMLTHQTSYILDARLSAVPSGAIGELYIGGEGLARGYLNKSALTLERFIPNPFQTDYEKSLNKNSRIYKTGDLVRRLPDGSLEYIGRNDMQLKIRGYRVETGEIESMLCAYPGIKQAVVLKVNFNNLPCHERAESTEINKVKQSATSKVMHSTGILDQNDHGSRPTQSNILPIQEWFFAQNFKNINHWNQSFLIRTPQLDTELLKISLRQIVDQHPSFSFRFNRVSDAIQLSCNRNNHADLNFRQLDLGSIPYPEESAEFNNSLFQILTEWQSDFDIATGPLYTTGYIHGYKDGSTRVYFALHHLIVDVISAHILVHQLKTLYMALTDHKEKNLSLAPKLSDLINLDGTSYLEWVKIVRNYAVNHGDEKTYWINVLNGHREFDRQLEKLISHINQFQQFENLDDHSISFSIDQKLTSKLLNENSLTSIFKTDEILLAAYSIAIKKLFVNSIQIPENIPKEAIFCIEGYGRQIDNTETDAANTLGWFTTMYPCKISIEVIDPPKILKQVKKVLETIPAHGLGYGALFGYCEGLPRTGFSYLGHLNNRNENSFWSISNEPSGQRIATINKTAHVIDLVCWIISGKLEFQLSCKFDELRTNQFAQSLKEELVALIEFDGPFEIENCRNVDHFRCTPKSDDQTYPDERLVAYYTSPQKLDQADIRDYLSKQLPQYSMPQEFIWLSSMPITINGKLDTKKLPRCSESDDQSTATPRNEKEKWICEAFKNILNKKNINLNDDFFIIGGDSISAINLTMQLQSRFNVKVRDIFSYRTPTQLAENLEFSIHTIRNKLLKIQHESMDRISQHIVNPEPSNFRLKAYLTANRNLAADTSQKKIRHVLLTGATGYLGCNLLNQLLKDTEYHLYLIIRAESDSLALERINDKYRLYFNDLVNAEIRSGRLSVFCGDLKRRNLGLTDDTYVNLTERIDSIIHSAALLKQFGDSDVFYQANVQATINLLEFSKSTRLKDFHYISTVSILKNNADSFKQWGDVCTEELYPEDLQPMENNIYLQTKLEAEQQVIAYRRYKLNTSIYRVGNLAFMSNNSSVQANINSVGFKHWLAYLFESKSVFLNAKVNISPVDLTANAIIKLFDKNCSSNMIYHVYNPHPFNLTEYMRHIFRSTVQALPMTEFIEHLLCDLENSTTPQLIMRFLIAQGWMDVEGYYQFSQQRYVQNRTQTILKKLGFSWQPVTENQFHDYLKNLSISKNF